MLTIKLVVLSALGMIQLSAAEEKKPHIIFLLADDQSTYSVGCYGNKEVKTPEMDTLGADGMIFDRHYNTTAICMASRANIFTGMYEYKTGTNFSHGDMKPEVWAKSYPVLLKNAGYMTAFAGKFGMRVDGLGHCVEEFDMWGGGPGQTSYLTAKNKSMIKYAEEYPHSTLSYAAFGRDAIREAVKQGKPLCLSISFKAPHKPATPDPSFDEVYKGKTFTKPSNFGRQHGEHLALQSKQGRQYERFNIPDWDYENNYDEIMRTYHQQIYGIDVALGMLRKELKEQGIEDNTVIIYTSDNGFICGSHGYGSKVLPMEEASRVPLLILDPRNKNTGESLRCGELTGNIDFAPTILDLAGLPIPENMDGQSLIPLLDDPTQGGHEQLSLMNTFGNGPTTAFTTVTSRYKYTFWWFGNGDMEPTEELFDLQNDPQEMSNLAKTPEYAELLKEMRSRYDKQHEKLAQEAVPYNNYQQYITLFDRTIPLNEKQSKSGSSKKEKSKK